jgi:hypothetical protein
LVWPQFANYNSTLLILGKFSQTGKCWEQFLIMRNNVSLFGNYFLLKLNN